VVPDVLVHARLNYIHMMVIALGLRFTVPIGIIQSFMINVVFLFKIVARVVIITAVIRPHAL
jgi:hypothetical protein